MANIERITSLSDFLRFASANTEERNDEHNKDN